VSHRIVTGAMMVLLGTMAVGSQPAPLTLRFVSPAADTYLTGPVQLRVVYDGEGGGALVEDVTFFADGRQICVAPGTRPQCEWDAGTELKGHAIRAVARLKAGGRIVANVRTKELDFVEAVDVDITLVNAVVTDGGRFVKGLTADAFRILDDAVPQKITTFQPTGAPLDLVLALDVSGSMKDALPDVKNAARAFLTALRPEDQVTLVTFNDSMFTLPRRLAHAESLMAAVDGLTAWGGTALYDVVVRSLQILSRQPGKHALVIFTDGDDRSSQATFEQVERLVMESDAMLFAVGLGQATRGSQFKDKLDTLADASGGRVLLVDRSDRLGEPFAEIVEDLANQYSLGFEPRRDGRYHELKVEVNGRGMKVRARRGYTAPGTR
jgi:VWFA-related protein